MDRKPGLYESVIDKLNALGLHRMAIKLDCMYSSSDFLTTDRLEIIDSMVSDEFDQKASRKLEARLRKCHLIGSPEEIGNCRDSSERTYSPFGIAEQLSDLSFIKRGYNVLILGCSDSGKSYFAKAIAIQGCAEYSGEYWHFSPLIDLLSDLRRTDPQKYQKFMKKLSKIDFLILDDFLISPLGSDLEASIAFTILESRSEKRKSTIICSQRNPKGWTDMLSDDKVVADAIIKRATRNYTVLITKKEET